MANTAIREYAPPAVNLATETAALPQYTIARPWGYAAAKRTLDVVASLAALLLTLPLLLLLAALVKLTSPGPVLFRQRRPGRGGRPFTILKFRTMVADAEAHLAEVVDLTDQHDPLIRLQRDPRVTRFGKFLRRTSLDELPQLLNILKGDMSLVGPRPISRPLRDPRNTLRLQVRPGLTGLWQISGRKNHNTDFMLQKDMQYLEARSFTLDLWILFRTVGAVLRADGAR